MSSSTTAAFDYDAIPVGYYDEIFHRQRGMQSKWHHLKFAHVRKEFPPTGRHVDVACGPGTFVGTLPESIYSIGVDISEPQITYASLKYAAPNHDFRTMIPGKLDFPDNFADIVTSIELIEHIDIKEATRLLRECHRILKPGGKMIITTPNYAYLWPLIECLLNRLGKVTYQDQHITKFYPRKLHALLIDAGFPQVTVETCLWTAPFAAALGWKFSNAIDRLESGTIGRKFGHLLLGVAFK